MRALILSFTMEILIKLNVVELLFRCRRDEEYDEEEKSNGFFALH